MPDPEPTAAIFSKLVITHKHEVSLFNKYHSVYRARNKVISQLIPEKYYKSLSNRITSFTKVTFLQILTHLITKYAELEDDDIQEIDRRNEGTDFRQEHFEEFIEKIRWNQEAVTVNDPYTPAQIVSMVFANIEKCGLYQDNFWEWSRKPMIDKIWSNFKAHFVRAIK